MTADENIIDVAATREHILDYLRDGPHPKRNVIDYIGCSRSTVDRAIEELTDAGLVARRNGRYETTLAGVLALKTRRQYDRNALALAEAVPALEPLWKEEPLEMAVLRDATVTVLEESCMAASLSELEAALRRAETIRGLLPAVSSVDQLDAIHTTTVRDDASVQLVCSEGLYEVLKTDYPGWLREIVLDGETSLRSGSTPGFGLFVTGNIDRRTVWLIVYDEGRLHALLQNETPDAVEWSHRCFKEFWADGTDRGEEIDANLPPTPFSRPTGDGPILGDRTASASAVSSVKTVDEESDALLGGGYAVNRNRLRTPGFTTEGDCTVTLWFNTDGFDREWEILVRWDQITLGIRHGKFYAHVFDTEAKRKRARTVFSTDRIRLNHWHHVAYSYDESTARLYLDGDVVDETTDDYPLAIEPLGAALGYMYLDADTGVFTPDFGGQIADARFYETRLSTDAIQRIYRSTSPTMDAVSGS